MKYKHGLHFDYPKDIHAHMISPEQVRNDVLDENFPYYDKSKKMRFIQTLFQFVFLILVFPANYLRYGCKIKGKDVLKRYKNIYKDGFISVSNHVFEWDYICVRSALKPKRGYMTIWKDNHNSSLGKLMRIVGSIPIPDKNNVNALCKFNESIEEALNERRMVHFYPEGSMWYFYEGLRDFLPGAFHYAVKCNKPVIPLAISYRPPKGLFKLWKRNGAPLVTIQIGEPLFPDQSLSHGQAIEKLRQESFISIKTMMENNTPNIK